jgi:hypothetical protein
MGPIGFQWVRDSKIGPSYISVFVLFSHPKYKDSAISSTTCTSHIDPVTSFCLLAYDIIYDCICISIPIQITASCLYTRYPSNTHIRCYEIIPTWPETSICQSHAAYTYWMEDSEMALDASYYDSYGRKKMYRYIQIIDITSINSYRLVMVRIQIWYHNKQYFAMTDIVRTRNPCIV